jgi:formylglycine-generating enzyme required for sulfatase activity
MVVVAAIGHRRRQPLVDQANKGDAALVELKELRPLCPSLGLFDMLGNAWEWCFDEYVESPKQAALVFAGAVTNQAVENRVARVLRGGAFDVHPQFVRSACRVDTAPANRDSVVGFRPARTYP